MPLRRYAPSRWVQSQTHTVREDFTNNSCQLPAQESAVIHRPSFAFTAKTAAACFHHLVWRCKRYQFHQHFITTMSITTIHCWREPKGHNKCYPLFYPPQVRGSQGQTQKGQAGQSETDWTTATSPTQEKGTLAIENICMRHPREFSFSAVVFRPSKPAGKQVPATGRKTVIYLLTHVFLHEVSFAMCSDTLPLPEANLLLKLFTVCCEGEDEAC